MWWPAARHRPARGSPAMTKRAGSGTLPSRCVVDATNATDAHVGSRRVRDEMQLGLSVGCLRDAEGFMSAWVGCRFFAHVKRPVVVPSVMASAWALLHCVAHVTHQLPLMGARPRPLHPHLPRHRAPPPWSTGRSTCSLSQWYSRTPSTACASTAACTRPPRCCTMTSSHWCSSTWRHPPLRRCLSRVRAEEGAVASVRVATPLPMPCRLAARQCANGSFHRPHVS